jgi:hypothetical protein
MQHTECPHCGITWEGQEIPHALHKAGPYTLDEAMATAAEFYGWTPENKVCFSINVVGVETRGYDGVSYWECLACGKRTDRFTKGAR